MIRINDVHAIQLISKAARVQFVPHLHHCIAEYNSRDQLVGGVLFTDWNYGSLLTHIALSPHKGMLCRQLLWLTCQYAFNQLGAKKMIALVPEWNIASRNLCLRLGYEIEYKIDDIFNNPPPLDNGMYIMSMKREKCKWLKMKPPTIEFAPRELINELPTVEQLSAIPADRVLH
jgi:hypothetical protein